MHCGLETIDTLARLRLTVRRLGGDLRLVQAPPELRELIAFVGLGDVLVVEPGRQPEEREEGVGLEEERELRDPTA
jgi:anti-anti-sigma regulatory factor